VGDALAVGGELGVDEGAGAGLQLGDPAPAAADDVELARQADEDLRAVAGELESSEPAGADALPLAARLLLGGELLLGALEDRFGGEQLARLAGGDVELVE